MGSSVAAPDSWTARPGSEWVRASQVATGSRHAVRNWAVSPRGTRCENIATSGTVTMQATSRNDLNFMRSEGIGLILRGQPENRPETADRTSRAGAGTRNRAPDQGAPFVAAPGDGEAPSDTRTGGGASPCSGGDFPKCGTPAA